MRVLWVTNVPLQEALRLMGKPGNHYGGWIDAAASGLLASRDIDLSVASPSSGVRRLATFRGHRVTHYAFPRRIVTGSRWTERMLKALLLETAPDIVHLRGTESHHALPTMAAVRRAGIPVVVEIQGVMSLIAQHMTAGLPHRVVTSTTARSVVRRDSVQSLGKRFVTSGIREQATLALARHVIGRTTFDRACVSMYAPEAVYHECNESLREPFYNGRWASAECEPYSVLVSQGHYSIKGLHLAVEALSLLRRSWPNATLHVAGRGPVLGRSFKMRQRSTAYGNYLSDLIDKLDLRERVMFLGALDAPTMRKRFLSSHVYLLPSSIENSPNSLAEAMALGVPCVASAVGGVPDLARHGENAFLYQWDAPYMAAYHISQLFGDSRLAEQLGRSAAAAAHRRHDRTVNAARLLEIYDQVRSDGAAVDRGGVAHV